MNTIPHGHKETGDQQQSPESETDEANQSDTLDSGQSAAAARDEDSPPPAGRRPQERVMGVNQILPGSSPLQDAEPGSLPPRPDVIGASQADLEEYENRVQQLEQELASTREKYLRSVADSDNLRKRSARERQDVSKFAISSFAKDLLDFADNFHRAIDSVPPELIELDERIKGTIGGIEAMERELLKIFEKHGIVKMQPLDEQFNPNYHEVMFEAGGTGKPRGTIIQIIEPGYMLHDRLLRPARVGVAKDEGAGQKSPPGGHTIDEEI